MKKLTTIAVCALLGVAGSAQAAGNPDAGKQKATTVCAACHGPTGVSSVPTYPNLCGQKAEYLVSSMQAYKEGQRSGSMAAIMAPMAKPLTDQEIQDVAAYYSNQPCK
jgi:cytochrome c553